MDELARRNVIERICEDAIIDTFAADMGTLNIEKGRMERGDMSEGEAEDHLYSNDPDVIISAINDEVHERIPEMITQISIEFLNSHNDNEPAGGDVVERAWLKAQQLIDAERNDPEFRLYEQRIHTLKENIRQIYGDEAFDNCGLCMVNPRDARLSCNHTFCATCIGRWQEDKWAEVDRITREKIAEMNEHLTRTEGREATGDEVDELKVEIIETHVSCPNCRRHIDEIHPLREKEEIERLEEECQPYLDEIAELEEASSFFRDPDTFVSGYLTDIDIDDNKVLDVIRGYLGSDPESRRGVGEEVLNDDYMLSDGELDMSDGEMSDDGMDDGMWGGGKKRSKKRSKKKHSKKKHSKKKHSKKKNSKKKHSKKRRSKQNRTRKY